MYFNAHQISKSNFEQSSLNFGFPKFSSKNNQCEFSISKWKQLMGGGVAGRIEQTINGVVENKPLPVNSNDTKVVGYCPTNV